MSRNDHPQKMANMEAWMDEVKESIGVDASEFDPIQDTLLDLIAKVAHGPSRPGAPLTAYLIGLAAGKGLGEADELISRVSKLADETEIGK